MSAEYFINKKIIIQHLENINAVEKDAFKEVFLSSFDSGAKVHVSRPFDAYNSLYDFGTQFIVPLLESFPDVEIQPYIVMGGKSGNNNCVCVAGNFIGTFAKDWLGIQPTNQPTYIRFHSTYFIKDGKITKAWFLLDILDVIRQAGYHLFPFRGLQQVAPAPMSGDGVVDYPVNPEESLKSYDLTNAMIDGLLEFDGETLDSMGQERFWDVPNMMWYGPGGIGTTRGLKGFQKNHQAPFLKAFPDRGVLEEAPNSDYVNIAEGNYTCHFGYPIMYGRHLGDDWLGLKATHKSFTMRVMDFWRREGDVLRENWVMIDMIDVLEQFGVNVFDLVKNR